MSPDSHEAAEVLNEIREFAPQIHFVGMGMPWQEHWIHANQRNLESKIVHSVGAVFYYEAIVQEPASAGWEGSGGVAVRWIGDPRRLFSRYCIEPWWIFGPAFRDLLGRFREPRTRSTRPDRHPSQVEAGS